MLVQVQSPTPKKGTAMTGLFLVLALGLWANENTEFLDTVQAQRADGYVWNTIECRAPDESVPYLAIETPLGNKYVCNKLEN